MDANPISGSDSGSPDFYIHRDGVNYGPESAGNLHLLCAQGWLQRDDLVWREGLTEWQAAASLFPSSFGQQPTALPVSASSPDSRLDESTIFEPGHGALRFSAESNWPWGSVGTAIVIHVALFFAVFEVLHFYPPDLTPYTLPVSPDPPLEVAMVPEPQPVSQPPPPPETPPPESSDPIPPLPTPPVPLPDLPPPPPAPAEMPVPSMTTPPVAMEPITPPPMLAETPRPPAVHHKARPLFPQMPIKPLSAPEDAPAPSEPGQPEYLADPRPEYPIEARQRHQQGTVMLLVTMDEGGNPVSVSVEKSSGYGVLDHAALKKVSAEWRFKPGQGATVHVPVEFHLDE